MAILAKESSFITALQTYSPLNSKFIPYSSQSTFQQLLLNTCGILRCFQNKPKSPKERTPALLYCLEDGPGQNFWTLLYHAEYLWNLPKNKNFYEIMAQGDKQYISTVKVLLKNKGSL